MVVARTRLGMSKLAIFISISKNGEKLAQVRE
jgi:hypothetical protein